MYVCTPCHHDLLLYILSLLDVRSYCSSTHRADNAPDLQVLFQS